MERDGIREERSKSEMRNEEIVKDEGGGKRKM